MYEHRGPERLLFERTSDFSIVAGGPLYRFAQRIGLTDGSAAGFVRLGLAIAAFTWLPLLALAPLGRGDTAISFLHSLGTHARLLVAIPLFFVAEAWFDKRSRELVRMLVAARLVRPDQFPTFRAALLDAIRWRDGSIVETVVVVIALSFILEGPRSDVPWGVSTWRNAVTGSLTPAGWWYTIVSFPLYQFLLWRWCVRMLVWSRLVWRINRLDLQLMPTHPDLAAGLAAFGEAHMALSPLSVAVSAMLAASIAEDTLYAGADVSQFALPLTGTVCVTVLLIVVPLLIFVPRLIRVRQEGLLEYGTLAAGYVHAFDDKWIRRNTQPREPLLGSADLQSLADLANSFDVIRRMRIVPIAPLQVLVLVAAAALPALPLVLFILPLNELILKVLGAVFKV